MLASSTRKPISLTKVERDQLLTLVPPDPSCDGCAADDLAASARDRLEGKSLDATAGTNFGRDKHEAALGSTVTSVSLSVAELDLLRKRLAASERPHDALAGKLELLREALTQEVVGGQSLAGVAASVGLGEMAGAEQPAIVPVTVLTGCLVELGNGSNVHAIVTAPLDVNAGGSRHPG